MAKKTGPNDPVVLAKDRTVKTGKVQSACRLINVGTLRFSSIGLSTGVCIGDGTAAVPSTLRGPGTAE